MTMLIAFLSCFMMYIVTAFSALEFSLISPSNGEIFSTLPNRTSLDLTIKYTIPQESTNDVSKICFQMEVDATKNEVFKETCTPSTGKNLIIANVAPNSYRLNAITVGNSNDQVGPIKSSTFQVLNYDDCLPNLDVTNNNFIFISNPNTNTSDIQLNFTITPRVRPITDFQICGQLYTIQSSNQGTNVTDINCFDTSETSMTVNNLPHGYYQMQFSYYDTIPQLYDTRITAATFEVAPMSKYIPNLSVLQSSYELIVDPTTKIAEELTIPYELKDGTNDTMEMMDLCIEIIDSNTNTLFSKVSCIKPVSPNVLRVQGLPAGRYECNLILRHNQELNTYYRKTLTTVSVEAQVPFEFIPTYEWQILKRWHTIPYGVETRLPLGETGSKEVRIPPIWRLQIPMPDVCIPLQVYFLRAEIDKLTRLIQIRNAAANLCKMSPTCLDMILDNTIVPFEQETESDYFTAESTNLFSRTTLFRINPSQQESCQQEIQVYINQQRAGTSNVNQAIKSEL